MLMTWRYGLVDIVRAPGRDESFQSCIGSLEALVKCYHRIHEALLKSRNESIQE
jgi:hypothetical protein